MIYIYDDEGAHPRSVQGCLDAIAAWTPYEGRTIDAEAIIHTDWSNVRAFIMPGGADLPYCAKLNGRGNQHIRHYIEQGGAYVGLCAGAYYAAAWCDFHLGDDEETTGARELAFYSGSAVGPTLAPYDVDSEKGMRVAHIQWGETSYKAYFNGGCHFPEAYQYDVNVLAHYTNEQRRVASYVDPLPAIIQCHIGKGRAVLSGVHPEYGNGDLFCRTLQAAISRHE